MTTKVEPQAATSDTRLSEVITLSVPIQRGQQAIDKVQLRRPNAGALRGLSTIDLIQADAAAGLKILPRITVPPLTQVEVDDLEPCDFLQLQGTIRSFFMTAEQVAMMEKAAAEQMVQ